LANVGKVSVVTKTMLIIGIKISKLIAIFWLDIRIFCSKNLK